MPWRQLRLGCHPPGLFDRLQALPGFNPREMLDMELEVKAIDGCPEDEYAELGRAAHPPRAALGRGAALPDGGASPPT